MDLTPGATAGTVIADIPQTGGADMAWYNKTDNRYYIGAGSYCPSSTSGACQIAPTTATTTPSISAIDAATNTWIMNVATGDVKDGKSIAVSPINNRAFVPVSLYGGIWVYQF